MVKKLFNDKFLNRGTPHRSKENNIESRISRKKRLQIIETIDWDLERDSS